MMLLCALLLSSGSGSPALARPTLAVPAGAAAPHVGSYSLSEVHVRQSRVQLQLRCQVLSLGEVIEPFDPDLDGEMEAGELDAHRDAIISYVTEHYRLYASAELPAESPAGVSGEAGSTPPAASVTGSLLEVVSATVTEAPMALDPLNEISEWLDVVVDFEVADLETFRALGVEMDLFYDTSPQHRDSAAVVWNGLELGAWQFAQGAESQVFVPTEEMVARNVSALVRYAKLGWIRAPLLLDAVLLALLFVLGARRGSRSSGLLSVALFAAAMVAGLVFAPKAGLLPQHVRFLELTVPLALAYVGLDDLLHNRGRTRVLETAVFGLALGGREATRLAPEIAQEASAQEPLLGFALGLSAALMAAAVGAGLALRDNGAPSHGAGASDHDESERRPGAFSWRPLRLAVDLGAIALGLWLFWGVFRG